MALQQDYIYKGVNFFNCYLKITKVEYRDITRNGVKVWLVEFYLSIYSKNTKEGLLEPLYFSFEVAKEADLKYTTYYNFIKTQPDYLNAIDI